MKKERLVLALCCCLLLFVQSLRSLTLQCDKTKVLTYSYYGVNENFKGGEPGTIQNTMYGEKSIITCKLDIQCVEAFQNKKNMNKATYLFAVNFTQVQMFQQNNKHPLDPAFFITHSAKANEAIFNGKKPVVPYLDSRFTLPFAYSLTNNGKLIRVYHHKKEKAWVTQVKKSIINGLQTKLEGDSRIEDTPQGRVRFFFQRWHNTFLKKKSCLICANKKNIPAGRK